MSQIYMSIVILGQTQGYSWACTINVILYMANLMPFASERVLNCSINIHKVPNFYNFNLPFKTGINSTAVGQGSK